MVWHISRRTLESDPAWKLSIGADTTKLHWRKGKLHATCKPNETICEVHEDAHDPYDFPISTALHLWNWNKIGAVGIGIIGLYVIDQVFNNGKVTRKVRKELGI